uniref:Ion transport domain-containing protein n=1 Tax=Panagrolaimus sp. PS1159 TaxID=55785 RepID=A0AC35GKX5_9BILA
MLFKIFESFVKTIHIWVLAGLCFSASFKILIKENSLPWQPATNSTSSFLAMLVTFTKVSAMMTGELNADDILKENNWIANILLIIFEGLIVIILTNFMVSLAVGDVNDLRDTAEERVIIAKIWHFITVDSYYKSLSCLIPFLKKWDRKVIKNNVVFIHKKGDYIFNVYEDFSNVIFPANDENDSTFYAFNENSVTPNVAFLINETIKNTLLNEKDREDKICKIKRWLFGLNWSSAIKDVKKREFRFLF